MSVRRRLWPLLLASGIGFCILCALGFWQVQRLAEKNALIAKIDAQLTAAPITLSEALKRREAGEDMNYIAVTASGQFSIGKEIHKLTSHQGQPGFSVISPYVSADGVVVLVDRGTVPEAFADPATRPEKPTPSITGFLRLHDKGQGVFDAENNPGSNQWYWWDVPAMLGAAQVPPEAKVLDLVLHRLPAAGDTALPLVPAAKADLRNNHLGYAITWFGLAAALAVMTLLISFRRRHAET